MDPETDEDDLEAEDIKICASCPQCSKSLTEAEKILVLPECGHIKCGGCDESFIPLSGEFCVFCGTVNGKLQIKM